MPRPKLDRKYRHDFYFTKEIHEKLTTLSLKTGRPMTEIVEGILQEYFKRHKDELEV